MSRRARVSASSSHRWMTLSEASAFLGVDASTLRAWADAGRIHAFRTPGGHRRFARDELDVFVHRNRSGKPVRSSALIGRSGAQWLQGKPLQRIRGEQWYAAIDSQTAAALRHTCRRLMRALAGYISGGPRQRVYLLEGERASRALGASVASLQLTPSAAVRAFLSFRELVTRTVSTKSAPLDQKVRSIQHIEVFLNRALVRMMNAYDQHRPQASRASGGDNRARRTWHPHVKGGPRAALGPLSKERAVLRRGAGRSVPRS